MVYLVVHVVLCWRILDYVAGSCLRSLCTCVSVHCAAAWEHSATAYCAILAHADKLPSRCECTNARCIHRCSVGLRALDHLWQCESPATSGCCAVWCITSVTVMSFSCRNSTVGRSRGREQNRNWTVTGAATGTDASGTGQSDAAGILYPV